MMERLLQKRKFFSVLLVFILSGYSLVSAQEVESRAVKFLLNNTKDMIPPTIKIISPEIERDSIYQTNLETIDLIGEVTDESKIRFVSINNEIRIVNETGIFASTVSLYPGMNEIRFKSMDEYENIREEYITIEYVPVIITLADRIYSESRYFGLIFGIENYSDPDIPDLDNPIRDAQEIYNSLTSNYTFEPENIRFLKNPTRSDIIRELDQMRGKVTPDDNLLIFYAGHGYWDKEARIGYWLPSDATRESTVDWFRNSTLVDFLQAINSKHTLLITDACFAGSIFKARTISLTQEVVYERIYELPSRKAMTSGRMTEVPDESSFIKYLVQRLNENKKTYFSAEELFGNMKNAVISNSNVVPQYGEIQNVGNEGGDFIFLKRK